MSLEKTISKIFKNESFEKDGFVYKIVDIEHEKGENYNFYVNVTLPDKNQSYVFSKFEYDLNNHIREIYKYIGKSFGYYLYIFVNNKPTRELYISPNLLKDILEGIKEKFKTVSFFIDESKDDKLTFDIEISPNTKKEKFITISDNEIQIILLANVSNIKYKDQLIDTSKFDQKKLNDFAGFISDLILYSDKYRESLEDFFYYTLEPELRIKETDLYYSPLSYVREIDGREVSPNWGSFTIDDFIS